MLVAKDWGEILPSDYVGLLGADEAALIQAAALGQVPMRCRPSLEASLLMSEEARAEQRLLHKAIEKVRRSVRPLFRFLISVTSYSLFFLTMPTSLFFF